MGVLEIISGIGLIIDKIFPNQTELQKAAIALEMAKLQGELEVAKSQAEVNAVDAASQDKFQSRWRPAAAWMCLLALGIGVIVKIIVPSLLILLPIVGYHDLATLKYVLRELSGLDIEMFNTMLWGLLGLGAFRTAEKIGKK